MKKTDKLKQIIKSYQAEQNKLFMDYKEQEKIAREKYSPEGFKEEFRHGTWVRTAGLAWSNSDSAIREAMDIFDSIQEEMEAWVLRPLDNNIIGILNCANNFNLGFTLGELKIIEKSTSIKESYIGKRIFKGICEKSGYQVNVPTADDFLRALDYARNETRFSIEAFAGNAPEFPGRDLLPERKRNDIVLGEFEPHHLYMASNFLHEGGVLDKLEELWSSAKAPLKYTLNPTETEKVKRSIEKIVDYGKIDTKAADELIKAEPDLISKLESMPDGSLKEFESVTNYFGLNEIKTEGEESKISTLLGKDKAPGLGQVNQDILKQYM